MTGCGQKTTNSMSGYGIDAYVYVPQFHELPNEPNTYLNHFVPVDTKLFYLKVETENSNESARYTLYCIPSPESKEPQKINLSLPPNCEVLQMQVDQDSNFWFALREHNDDYSVITFHQRKYNSKGIEILDIDVTQQLNENTESAYMPQMCVDAEGNWYWARGQIIWLYQASGQYQGKVEIPQSVNDMEMGKDGNIYVLYEDGGTQYLTTIDFNAITTKKVYQDFPCSNMNQFTKGMDADFLVNNGSGLLTVDMTTQTQKKILDWMDSDLSSQSIWFFYALPDGRIAVVLHDNQNDESTVKIVYLTKTLTTELPEKEIISAASIYEIERFREEVIRFNQSNDRYRILLKSYADPQEIMSPDVIAEAISSMYQDITSDRAPDLLFVNSSTINLEYYASKGLFADLSDLMKRKELNKNDLVDSVVKAFTYQKKLIALPTDFYIQTLVGKTDVIGDKPGWSFDSIQELMAKYPDKVFTYISKEEMLRLCLSYQSDVFIDWENDTYNFQNKEFYDLLEFCNKMPMQAMAIDHVGETFWPSNDQVMVKTAYIQQFRDYQFLTKVINEPITCIGFPTKEGNAASGILPVDGVYTIHAKSKHKKGAWAFIQHAIFEREQNAAGFPIRQSALDQVLEKVMTEDQTVISGDRTAARGTSYLYWDDITYDKGTQEEVNGLKELIDTATVTGTYPTHILRMISEECRAYFDGQVTVEEAAQAVQERLQ
jgi:ABC-type glycerol-3-phosphate transport system substrate-binding protein